MLLFLAVACNIPEQRQESDENFNAQLSEAKRQVEFYPDSALMILRELLPGQQGEEKAVNRGKVLNLTGVAYDVKGIYDSAAYYLYEASQLAEKIQDDSLQMSVYTNLGILQFEMNNADEAIKYYQQSLAIAEQLKDSTIIANQLNNIGNTYLTITHELEKAIPYFERCMEITEQTRYSRGTLVAGINLAQIYNELGELDKAMVEINRLAGIDENYIYTDFTLGEIQLKKGRYGESLHTFKNLLNKQLEQEKQLIATQAVLDGEIQERIRVAHHLMPESLGSTGLKQSIADFCNSVPIVKFSYYGDDTRLNPNLEVMIYRIMHELVSNALKHSGASHILVEIA